MPKKQKARAHDTYWRVRSANVEVQKTDSGKRKIGLGTRVKASNVEKAKKKVKTKNVG